MKSIEHSLLFCVTSPPFYAERISLVFLLLYQICRKTAESHQVINHFFFSDRENRHFIHIKDIAYFVRKTPCRVLNQ